MGASVTGTSQLGKTLRVLFIHVGGLMKTNVKHVLMAGAFLLLSAAPAIAGAYGALATSPDADYGWSKNYDSADEAEERALRECRKYSRNCTVKKVFRNVCVSVASSTNGAMGWAWGYDRSEGNARAMSECRDNRGKACRVVERFCTGDADDN